MKKKDRIPKLLQDVLSRFIKQNMPISTFGALTTITEIQVTPNLSLARIYLSFIPTGKQIEETFFLTKIKEQTNNIKNHLAHKLGNKLRIIPNIQFYIDSTAKKAIEIEKILASL